MHKTCQKGESALGENYKIFLKILCKMQLYKKGKKVDFAPISLYNEE